VPYEINKIDKVLDIRCRSITVFNHKNKVINFIQKMSNPPGSALMRHMILSTIGLPDASRAGTGQNVQTPFQTKKEY
jgi:hypothetical protein